jgi:molybdopterin-containing oxidoreductase family iron-sulfur binding subunit
MDLSRKEFLQTVWRAGLCIFGGSVVFDVVRGRELLAQIDDRRSTRLRYAMVIDIFRFAEERDYTMSVEACHRFHNVPDIPSKMREIAWIRKEEFEHAFPEQAHDYSMKKLKSKDVLVLCNHCDNPPCVRVCPTKATWRRKDGIVAMDMHRCIGCRFCMAACPYGSRSFNFLDPRTVLNEEDINPEYPTRTKGVVEKCDFCAEQVDRGKSPLCVKAAPDQSMIFGNISDRDSEIRSVLNKRYVIRRRPSLGTEPQVYYIV